MKVKKIFIIIFTSMAAMAAAAPIHDPDDNFTKEEMINTIYELQGLLNQASDPAMEDYTGLFAYIEGPEHIAHSLYFNTDLLMRSLNR